MTDTTSTPSALRTLKHRRQAAWRERNQLKVWAHKALASALRRGLLTRQPCEVCGDPNAEAHHPDHRNALDVQWLCRAHHKALHATEKAA
ncbi:hypothetical protein Rumeso_03436 [Rubellimicrobium mesophilum DSM 19309]|uniref:HNH endonuclease n=1 Tax=Rubellimicrobium mesophilum DSM 19309 TaxID=442562 RepID=A0A017HKK8_9RHOB|nr:hypothetical protein [Rubellimicrobium mesophilum]EYD75012.1 hypothetical protein Rumeso_03436 [Rubellimicrobium mesophilum DSM 19309]